MVGTAQPKTLIEHRFRVEGMDCPSCAQKIETALARIPGVSDVSVSVTTESLRASIADDATANAVSETVRKLGFRVSSLPSRRVSSGGEDACADDCCAPRPIDFSALHKVEDTNCHDDCCTTRSAPKPAAEFKFRVEGMDCPSCAQKIESALARVDGVSNVSVSVTGETLRASIRDDAAATIVTDTVRRLGFGISPLPAAGTTQPPSISGAATNDIVPEESSDPADMPWWRTRQGMLIVFTGTLLAAAFVLAQVVPQFALWIFIAACAAGVVPIARRAITNARYGSVFTIEMLMTVATVGALAIGAAEEAAVVIFLFAVGELLETIAAGRARAGIRALAQIAPKTALRETNGALTEVAIENLAIGDIVVVRPGDRVPADGTVTSGISSLDEAALTGESVPRLKQPGDAVFSGSINVESTLRCRVEKRASETLIARVVALVEEASESKAPSERFIERFARIYMPVICALAFIVAVLPPLAFGSDWTTWIYRGLTLLLIGCPCALVISTPAAIASALAAGARQGLLVKGGAVLEAIGKVKTIAFDKTGTLTEGKPKVTDVLPLADVGIDEVLRLAATVEATSSHPLAEAIVEHARQKGIAVTAADSSTAIPGKGVTGRVEAREISVTAARWVTSDRTELLPAVEARENEGKTVSIVLADGNPVGLIALRDEPRADAADGLRALSNLGIHTLMLTGDNAATAHATGKTLGIDVQAELLPEDKLSAIRALASNGSVAVVGDGINDAPALANATVGIAMGSGTDVALETADAAILHNRLTDVGSLVRLSRQTMAVVGQNVTVALGLKAVFLVTTIVGATGLWIAILADTGATVLVTLNSLRLLAKRD